MQIAYAVKLDIKSLTSEESLHFVQRKAMFNFHNRHAVERIALFAFCYLAKFFHCNSSQKLCVIVNECTEGQKI
uniref:Uncharacterized protein n=1 Tax=Trichuris muris TaxID=70415 RepID=A0A5S6QK33_TRIMR